MWFILVCVVKLFCRNLLFVIVFFWICTIFTAYDIGERINRDELGCFCVSFMLKILVILRWQKK